MPGTTTRLEVGQDVVERLGGLGRCAARDRRPPRRASPGPRRAGRGCVRGGRRSSRRVRARRRGTPRASWPHPDTEAGGTGSTTSRIQGRPGAPSVRPSTVPPAAGQDAAVAPGRRRSSSRCRATSPRVCLAAWLTTVRPDAPLLQHADGDGPARETSGRRPGRGVRPRSAIDHQPPIAGSRGEGGVQDRPPQRGERPDPEVGAHREAVGRDPVRGRRLPQSPLNDQHERSARRRAAGDSVASPRRRTGRRCRRRRPVGPVARAGAVALDLAVQPGGRGRAVASASGRRRRRTRVSSTSERVPVSSGNARRPVRRAGPGARGRAFHSEGGSRTSTARSLTAGGRRRSDAAVGVRLAWPCASASTAPPPDHDGRAQAAFVADPRAAAGPRTFPPDVLAEAAQAAASRPAAADPDLTDVQFVTIDPPGSTDLDQAMHLERRGDGYRVRLRHRRRRRLRRARAARVDAEAHRRVETLYAPDRRTPLHPPCCSRGRGPPAARRRSGPPSLWTIRPRRRRRGRRRRRRRARVRSRRRLDYAAGAGSALDAGAPPTSWPAAARARSASCGWRSRRRAAASTCRMPEQEVVGDGDGRFTLDAAAPPCPSRTGTRRSRCSPAWPPPR